MSQVAIETTRYRLTVDELAGGGPGGYEATYLTSEGNPATNNMYNLLGGDLLPAVSRVIRQRNGKRLEEALERQEQVGIASGFKPSGPYHFGHALTASTVAFFQQRGAQIFVPVADIECAMDGRLTRSEYMAWAADNLLDWGASGVDLDAAHVYLQSEEQRVSRLAYVVGRSLDFNLAADIYGFSKLHEDFPFLFAGITQVGDILLPQEKDFGAKHSFMVSGQDQDGHMKMTVELTTRSLSAGLRFLGVQSVPSGFYIPHMRGLLGDKASSSKTQGTLYLGSGPLRETIDQRIASSTDKFDVCYQTNRDAVEMCALDMVRYNLFFNARTTTSYQEVCGTKQYRELLSRKEEAKRKDEQDKVQREIDSYLLQAGEDNVQIVRANLADALYEHQRRRETVLRYALERTSTNGSSPQKPAFWKTPSNGIVDQGHRNQTKWYSIVSNAKATLMP